MRWWSMLSRRISCWALQALAANFHKQHSHLLYKGLIYIGLDGSPADCYASIAEELENAIQ